MSDIDKERLCADIEQELARILVAEFGMKGVEVRLDRSTGDITCNHALPEDLKSRLFKRAVMEAVVARVRSSEERMRAGLQSLVTETRNVLAVADEFAEALGKLGDQRGCDRLRHASGRLQAGEFEGLRALLAAYYDMRQDSFFSAGEPGFPVVAMRERLGSMALQLHRAIVCR